MTAWLRTYTQFLREFPEDEDGRPLTPKMAASNSMALEFLAEVADENKGRTRVAAAIRAIDFLRSLLGIPPLKADPRTTMLKRGVLRMHPHTVRGAIPFPAIAMSAIVIKWGSSRK